MKGTKPSIVFCHGIWADGSCFSKVIPALQAEGHQCIAAQYSLNTTADDVATVKRALGRVSSPAILVGHSYGGSVITGAGTDDRVAGLVYIAAFAPDADETVRYATVQVPEDRRPLAHRSHGRTHLATSGRHRFLRGRLVRGGKEAGLGDPMRAGSRPVRGESRRNRLEIEAKLVHRRQERPHHTAGL
jgi:pimeloyl-ACP methyl ester carboxylesterase